MGDIDNDGDLDVTARFGHWENYPSDLDGYEEINPLEQPDTLYLRRVVEQPQLHLSP